MPTRKQRRRREKEFRHEYETVVLDAEGNEVPFDEETAQRERAEKQASRTTQKRNGKQPARTRPVREVKPPTWERAFKRGGTWGAVLFVVSVLFFKGTSVTGRVIYGLLYAIAFVPLTYFIDRMAYRSYVRRQGAPPSGSGRR
jgi:hypothetical protein